jgi:hypothetical protein
MNRRPDRRADPAGFVDDHQQVGRVLLAETLLVLRRESQAVPCCTVRRWGVL